MSTSVHPSTANQLATAAITTAIPRIFVDPRTRLEQTMVREYGDSAAYRPQDFDASVELGNLTTAMTGMGKDRQKQGFLRSRAIQTNSLKCMYGQDAALMNTLTFGDLTVSFGAIADGHGFGGEVISQHAILGLQSHLFTETTMHNIHALVLAKDEAGVRAEMTRIFLLVDDTTKTMAAHGGSTLTAWILFHPLHGRSFLVSANVGDSPLMLASCTDGRVAEMAVAHNWDSIKERRASIQACKDAGRPIPEIIYARWNTDGNTQVPDLNGNQQPIRVFVGDTDQVDEANRDYVTAMMKYRGVAGGIQSRIKMVQLVQNSTTMMLEPESLPIHGHENFGSTPLHVEYDGTLSGGPQMSRGIGDSAHKDSDRHMPLMTVTPSVSIFELYSPRPIHLVLVACSDGPGDALYRSEIGEEAMRFFRASPSGTASDFTEHLYNTALREGTKFFKSRAWDDMSMICTCFTLRPSSS